METIRVLNLFTILNHGGAETMVMNYYRNIDKNKVQFDFLVHREEKGAYEDEIIKMGGRIYRLPPLYPQNFLKYKKEIKKFLEEHKEYKIIHSHMSELGYFALKEAYKQNIPIRICHAHNAPNNIDLKLFVRNYFKIMMKPYVNYHFICSEKAGNWLYGKKDKSKFIMMNNAVDTKKFHYDYSKRNKLRNDLKLNNDLVIGHIGRFNIQKNHIFLIDIFFEIQKKIPNTKLILIGVGECYEDIKIKVQNLEIQDKVLFLGARSDVNNLMQVMDVFLMPSLFEGLPVTLIEAQASGLPCIISDVISTQSIVTNLVKMVSLKEDAKYWADIALEHYKKNMSRKDTRKEIIKRGFDIKINSKWLEQFYLEEYDKYE